MISLLVLAAQQYQACHGLPHKTQQRFYARMMRLVGQVAADNGMDPADAFAQIIREAESRGTLSGMSALRPGKDY